MLRAPRPVSSALGRKDNHVVPPYAILETKQRELNEFEEKVIGPLLGFGEHERDEFGFTDIARRIADPRLRERYCQLAVALLDANINYYRFFAAPMSVEPYDGTPVIASTLIAAGIAYYFGGPVTTYSYPESGIGYPQESRVTILKPRSPCGRPQFRGCRMGRSYQRLGSRAD